MTSRASTPIKVVVCAPIMGPDLSPLRAFEPEVEVVDGNQLFEQYNHAVGRRDAAGVQAGRERLAALLSNAEVFCMSFPALQDAMALAPKLRWLHHTQAGVSNLWSMDVWSAPQVLLTSGRGHVRPTAMAEYTVAAALHFARGLHDSFVDKQNRKLDRSHYGLLRIEGATMGVVGLGGIGKEVARLSRALGMRVVATRRSVTAREEDVDGADLLLPPSELGALAAESDFLAICTQLTHETAHLINREVIRRMKATAVIVNVSRGEVIDEDALIEALAANELRGAVLDVYEGEMAGEPPRPELFDLPGVVVTPHLSAGGSNSGAEIMDLFCENLRRYIAGEPLINVVDRERGY